MDELDPYFQGSTKKILSLIKSLPDKDTFNDTLRKIIDDNAADRKKRRFNKHPRRIASSVPNRNNNNKEPFVILKKPSTAMLTDSSDEYCDVTVRRETLREYEEIGIAEHVLEKIVLDDDKLKFRESGKRVKDRENSVRRLGKDEEENMNVNGRVKDKEEDKPKEVPKLYIDRKLRGVIEKSIQVLQDIESLLNFGLDDSDCSEDQERRKKRAVEFASRFSRIHLYQLNRHVSDLEDMIRPSSGKIGLRPNVFSLNQKFHTANQTIYQGLQSYHKNLSVAIVIGAPEKLTDFIKVITSMCDLYRDYSSKHPTGEEETYNQLIENLEHKCKIVSDKVNDTLSNRKHHVFHGSLSDTSIQGRRTAPVRRSKSDKRKKLSMYNNSTIPIRGDVYWKRAIATLSQKKFDVPSRYKTATFKHRPPPSATPPVEEKMSFVPQKIVSKSDTKKSGQSYKHKVKKNINDIDNVSTLVQVQSEKEAGHPQSQTMRKLAQEFFNKVSKGEEEMTQEQYECILDHFIAMVHNDACDNNTVVHDVHAHQDPIKLEQTAQDALEEKLGSLENMGFDEFVEKFMASVNNDIKKNQQAKDEEEKHVVEREDDIMPVKKINVEKKQSVTITGAKNAPLICIKEDSSTSCDEKPSATEITKKQENERSARSESQSELIYKERPDAGDFSKSISKLTRVQKTDLRQVEMLPKDSIVKIIEYKLQFHKETKNNYMYKKSGSMSPLNLVERISDKLLDEALMSITRDIQVEEILQKVYSQEFK